MKIPYLELLRRRVRQSESHRESLTVIELANRILNELFVSTHSLCRAFCLTSRRLLDRAETKGQRLRMRRIFGQAFDGELGPRELPAAYPFARTPLTEVSIFNKACDRVQPQVFS